MKAVLETLFAVALFASAPQAQDFCNAGDTPPPKDKPPINVVNEEKPAKPTGPCSGTACLL